MAIKIRVGNLVVEADNEADVRSVFSALGLKDGAIAGLDHDRQPAVESAANRRVRLYPSLRTGAQQAVLKALARNPEGLSDKQLREAVGVANNNVLAGTLAGISKSAKALGLRIEQVLTKQTVRGREGRRKTYHYRLTDKMVKVANDQKWGSQAML